MGIANIGKFIRNIGAHDIYELVSKAAKKCLKRADGRTRSVFSGSELEELGFDLGKIEQPRLVIGGNNTKKGQSVWSAVVYDANDRPVEVLTAGYDTTRGKATIVQSRKQIFDGDKKVFAESKYFDANRTVPENPVIDTSIKQRGGVTRVSANIDDMYRFEIQTVGPKKNKEIEDKLGIYFRNSKHVKDELKSFVTPEEAKEHLKFLKDAILNKKLKTPYAVARLRKIEKMDLNGLEKEIQLQLSRLQKQEQELDKLYAKVYGTGEKAPNWREEFVECTVSRINPLTGKQIPVKAHERINKKIKEYSDTRAIIMMAAAKKAMITGSETLDRKYIAKMIAETGITLGETADKVMIEELKALRGLTKAEMMERAKGIVCKRRGLPADLVEIKPVSDGLRLEPYSACFEETNACLYYHPTLLELPDEVVAGLIRHELDHFEVLAKMAKTMGIEEYKALACRGNEESLKRFNDAQWGKIIERITVEEGFNPEPYKKALQEYTTPWGDFADTIKYLSNPLELRAYQAGMEVEVALNDGNLATLAVTQLIKTKIGTDLQNVLAEMKEVLGGRFLPSVYAENLKQKAINSVKDISNINFETDMFNEALKIARRDLAKAKEGTFEGAGFMKIVKAEKISSVSKSMIKDAKTGKIKKSVFRDLKKTKVPILLQSKMDKAAKEKFSA